MFTEVRNIRRKFIKNAVPNTSSFGQTTRGKK